MIALTLSFAGLLVHNLREFPVSVLVRGDTLLLLALTIALGAWWLRTHGPWARRALLGWGLLHLLGGGLIVGGGLPILIRDLLGTEAAYDLRHHASHWIYGAASIPLVVAAWRVRPGHAVVPGGAKRPTPPPGRPEG